MKVVVYGSSLYRGAVENISTRLAQGLSQWFEVEFVIAYELSEQISQLSKPKSAKFHSLGIRRSPEASIAPILIPAAGKFISYIQKAAPRAVIAHSIVPNITSIMAKSWLDSKVTGFIVTEHSNLEYFTKNFPPPYTWSGLRARLGDRLASFAHRRADRAVGVSEGITQMLIRRGVNPAKARTIYNPAVDDELFRMAEEEVEHPFFQGKEPVILGVGRLDPQKDFPTLIRAFAKVRKQVDAKLVILGEGGEQGALTSLIRELGLEESVDLPGFQHNPFKFMKRASVFVLSSVWESFAMVLAEALALGTPIVSTDCPYEPAEILEGGKWGYLVPPSRPEALAEGILKALEKPIHAPPEAWERFTVERAVLKYKELVEEVVGERG